MNHPTTTPTVKQAIREAHNVLVQTGLLDQPVKITKREAGYIAQILGEDLKIVIFDDGDIELVSDSCGARIEYL